MLVLATIRYMCLSFSFRKTTLGFLSSFYIHDAIWYDLDEVGKNTLAWFYPNFYKNIRVGRGSKIASKKGHYRVGQGR